jgi:hypothetical protein
VTWILPECGMVPDSSHQLSPIEEYRILLSEEVVQYIFLKENTILSNFRNVVFIFIALSGFALPISKHSQHYRS